MKFLLVTLGSIGDLLPFMAVAEGLRQRGHSIVIASNAGYAQLVQGAGFEFSAIWDRPQKTLDDVLAGDPAKAWKIVHQEMFEPATGPTFDFIAHHARQGPCTVLASWSAFGARLAYEKLSVPLCSAYLSPHALEESGGGMRLGFFPAWFASHGAPLPGDVQTSGFPLFEDALIPALPPELESFLQKGSAPVIFTPGSFMRNARDFFEEAVAACRHLKRRAIFLTPYGEQVPADLPPAIRHFHYVALQRLAPRAAALVHHGGIGTAVQAMRAGIPQLVSPVFFDQFDNAGRLEALGVALRTKDGDMAAGLETLLSAPEVKQNCARVKALLAADDGVRDICDLLGDLQ